MRALTQALTPAVAAMALSAVWLLSPAAVNAQNQPPDRTRGQSGSTAISDPKLDAAAATLEQVTNINQTYRQRLANASPTDKPRIIDEANNAMEKAVTDHGLSVEEYTSILTLAQNDASVRNKLIQRIHPSGQ